jgi:hypothetical protein
MAAADEAPASRFTVVVDAPGEIFAGNDMTLKVRVSNPAGADFNKMRIAIRNQNGAELARAALTRATKTETFPLEMVVKAPATPGDHTYSAALVVPQPDETARVETTALFSFKADAHTVILNVWDLATAIEAGGKFSLKLGVRCVAGCRLHGRPVAIFDQENHEAGSAKLNDEVWPGTTALYYTTLEATAPKGPSEYRWEVRSPASSVMPPHAAAALDFVLRVVSPPEHEVTFYAVDKDKQSPIKDARVVMHPYRAMTDENGVARVKVTKGEYNVVVAAKKYLPTGWVETIAGDVVIKAELQVEPPPASID